MLKKTLPGLFLTLCVSCCMLACNEKNCDDVQINVCNGNFAVTGCQAGEPVQHDCKEDSLSAVCGVFSDGFPQCYEPCTTKDETRIVCIDHTTDTDYNPGFCIMEPGSSECIGTPSQRPDTFRREVCKIDEKNGILYWDKETYGEDSCYNPLDQSVAMTCCFKAGKLCSDRFGSYCEQTTNTAIFCNNNSLVEFKPCSSVGDGYICDDGRCCKNGDCI